jgi:hypothetical protein
MNKIYAWIIGCLVGMVTLGPFYYWIANLLPTISDYNFDRLWIVCIAFGGYAAGEIALGIMKDMES